jgi:hypothetical protein
LLIPPIPPECQALADEVTALETRVEDLRHEAAAAIGLDAWKLLADLAALRQELDRKRAELDSCVRAHAAALGCDLVILDASGDAAVEDRVAHLWDVGGATPILKETVSVQGASFSFAGPLPGNTLGITVTAAEAAPGKGPDFRSGPVGASPPASPQLRLESVFGPTITVTGEDISRWLSRVVIPPQSLNLAGMGTVNVSLSSVSGTLVESAIELTAAGTISIPTLAVQDSPFSASADVEVVPSTSPDALLPAELTIARPPSVQLPGPLAVLGAALNVALPAGLFDLILPEMRRVVDTELSALVARTFSLLHLPQVTLSVRALAIGPLGITFQPALGAVGTGLSSFQPDLELLPPP